MPDESPGKDRFQQAYVDKAPWDIDKPQPVFVAAADRISGSILDAGCGTGENALFFAARCLVSRASSVEQLSSIVLWLNRSPSPASRNLQPRQPSLANKSRTMPPAHRRRAVEDNCSTIPLGLMGNARGASSASPPWGVVSHQNGFAQLSAHNHELARVHHGMRGNQREQITHRRAEVAKVFRCRVVEVRLGICIQGGQ